MEATTKPHVTRRRSKEWYLNVLLFYREFWQAALEAGLDRMMSEAVHDLELSLRNWSGRGKARVTVVDAIDKFLYLSSGDARELGLAGG